MWINLSIDKVLYLIATKNLRRPVFVSWQKLRAYAHPLTALFGTVLTMTS